MRLGRFLVTTVLVQVTVMVVVVMNLQGVRARTRQGRAGQGRAMTMPAMHALGGRGPRAIDGSSLGITRPRGMIPGQVPLLTLGTLGRSVCPG